MNRKEVLTEIVKCMRKKVKPERHVEEQARKYEIGDEEISEHAEYMQEEENEEEEYSESTTRIRKPSVTERAPKSNQLETRAVRVNICLPPDVLAKGKEDSWNRHLSFSAYLASLIMEK